MDNEEIKKLIAKWYKDANTFKAQVEECRKNNVPHAGMLAEAITLINCAKELEKVYGKSEMH